MANKLIPWQRYLSDIAHKYVGYPDDEEGGEEIMIIHIDSETGLLDKTCKEIADAAHNQVISVEQITEVGATYALFVGYTEVDTEYNFYFTSYSITEAAIPVIITANGRGDNSYPAWD